MSPSSRFFDRLGSKLDPTSKKSWLNDISKDATFKKVSGSITDSFTGVLGGLTGAFRGVTSLASGNTIYIILAIAGVGVVGYTVSNFTKKL